MLYDIACLLEKHLLVNNFQCYCTLLYQLYLCYVENGSIRFVEFFQASRANIPQLWTQSRLSGIMYLLFVLHVHNVLEFSIIWFAKQLRYNPRHLTGFGLTDGEGVERLWSYLRRFARMTKEMRPSHRIDVLCDALLQYARKSANRLCMLILMCMSNCFSCS